MYPEPIPLEQLDIILKEKLPEWTLLKTNLPDKLNEEKHELFRSFTFNSFISAIKFMASVAPGCDRMNHHPKWENNWRTLDVYITTHDLDNKISSLDIELANYFNVEFNNFEEYIKKQN